jgi:NADH-quinone oxidoreductase subunit N
LGRIAMALVFGGLAFRITAVPFHFYAPDVFAGSSLPVAAMLATVPKVAGFLAIIRLLGGSTLESRLSGEAELLLFALALVTMTLGNCLALAQNVWRRLLAYSSVAHSGYLLLGVVAALHLGSTPQSILVYLAAYVVMTMGVFAGLAAIQGRSNEEMRIDQVTSLAQGNRGLAIAMTICLLSLIGIPLTGSPLILTGAVVMAINAAIAAIYYLRIIGNLLMSPSKGQGSVATIPWSAAAWTCVVCALVTVTWFIVPGWM